MRAGSRFGVHFFESVDCIDSIVKVEYGCFAVFEDCAFGVVGWEYVVSMLLYSKRRRMWIGVCLFGIVDMLCWWVLDHRK